MKKIISILLCLVMVSTFISCNCNNANDNEENYTNSDTTGEIMPDDPSQEDVDVYRKILDIYRRAIEILPDYVDEEDARRDYCTELGIIDEEDRNIFNKIFWSTFLLRNSIPYKASCGYDIKDLNGDGVDELVLFNSDYMVIAIFSAKDNDPVLLSNYQPRDRGWIDEKGLIHGNGSSGAAYSTNAIYKIADGGGSMELIAEFGTNGPEWVGDTARTRYYKLVNGKKADITEAEFDALSIQYGDYLGYEACAEATEKYSGLEFTPMYTEAEIAMEMYEAALKNEIKVYETNEKEYYYLKDCESPYDRFPLCAYESLRYVYMDVDGDLINELVIHCGDILILHYYEGCVYVYPFRFRDMYRLNTDGSYNWNQMGPVFQYGENQLSFDGAKLKSKELWRVVDNAEFYVEGKQVTQEEFSKYTKDNPKTEVEFLPLEVSWLSDGKGKG